MKDHKKETPKRSCDTTNSSSNNNTKELLKPICEIATILLALVSLIINSMNSFKQRELIEIDLARSAQNQTFFLFF